MAAALLKSIWVLNMRFLNAYILTTAIWSIALSWFMLPASVLGNPITIQNIIQTEETCNLSNGTLTIMATGGAGPLLYSVDGGTTIQNSNFFDNLESGDYLILVTDGIDCTEFETAQIADASEPELSFSYSCLPGLNSATIDLVPFEGISPYSYNWQGPGGTMYTTEDLMMADPGQYFITVTDALGCTVDSSLIVDTCCELQFECNLQDTVYLNCLGALPELDSVFFDNITTNDEDRIAFETMGASHVSSCNDIVVSVFESSNNAGDCRTEEYILTRIFTVDDGVSEIICRITYVIDDFSSVIVDQPAQNVDHSCVDNPELAFNAWLADYGNAKFRSCSDPVMVTTAPQNPQLIYSCPGSASAEVTFYVRDNCNTLDSTTAVFSFVDTIPPDVNCPVPLTMQYDDPNLETTVLSWIQSANATDDCTNSTLVNNFNLSSVLGECEADEDIIFLAEDECGNAVECSTNLRVVNDIIPNMVCPVDLHLECGDMNNLNLVDTWLNSVIATDQNSMPLPVNSDYNAMDFSFLECGDMLTVSFAIEDACLRTNTCSAVIFLEDTTAPSIDCPQPIDISSTYPDYLNSITTWIGEGQSSDNCTDVILTNNFDANAIGSLCAIDFLEVNFIAADECGNQAECSSVVNIVKNDPIILCPPELTIECADPQNESIISNWLNEASAFNNSGATLIADSDFDILELANGCDVAQEVMFLATDECAQVASCMTSIRVFDSTSPEISCPEDISIDVLDTFAGDQIQDWLAQAEAIDNCGLVEVTHNLSLDLDNILCEAIEVVRFTAIDDCNNYDECTSRLELFNSNDLQIICPEPIELACSHPQLEELISGYINQVEISSQLEIYYDNNFEFSLIDINCIEEQTIEVLQIVQDICGNSSTCSSEITIIPDAQVYIPNIFSPNGDGINDYFTLYGNSSVIKILHFTVYNRWGEKIFEAEDINPNEDKLGWDGYYKGKIDPISVYTYHIFIIDYFNAKHEFSGTIQLVR